MVQSTRRTDLRFNDLLEKEYLNYSSIKDRKYIRVAYMLFAILYGLFSITDYYLVPEWFDWFFAIRFYVVIPILLITVVLTFISHYNQWKQIILIISYIVGALGIVFMLIVEPLNVIYYGGLFLIFTSAYFMLNLNTENVVISSLFILFVLVVGWISTNNINLTTETALLFFFAQNIIGAIGAYQIEQFRRNEFLHVYSLNVTQAELNQMVHEKIEEISKAQISTIFALARLAESRDKDTGEHIERVGELCYALSEILPVDYFKSSDHKLEFIKSIRLASALHDIGKVAISDTILNKPGMLTNEEFEIMKTHVVIGTNTLAKLHKEYPNNSFVSLGIEITQCHHEKWNGTGYPNQLHGIDIPLSARIMAIVDVYDALISHRSYKEAYEHTVAMDIIRNESGKHFDPALVAFFETLFVEAV
jgi:hypothetical protein